jgi:hypothetical protein
MDEACDIESLREALGHLQPVLCNPMVQTIRNAGVEHPRLAGQNVNEPAFHVPLTPRTVILSGGPALYLFRPVFRDEPARSRRISLSLHFVWAFELAVAGPTLFASAATDKGRVF